MATGVATVNVVINTKLLLFFFSLSVWSLINEMSSLQSRIPPNIRLRIWHEAINAAKLEPGVHFYSTETEIEHKRVVLPRSCWNLLHVCRELREQVKKDPELYFGRVQGRDGNTLEIPRRPLRPKVDVIYLDWNNYDDFCDGVKEVWEQVKGRAPPSCRPARWARPQAQAIRRQ